MDQKLRAASGGKIWVIPTPPGVPLPAGLVVGSDYKVYNADLRVVGDLKPAAPTPAPAPTPVAVATPVRAPTPQAAPALAPAPALAIPPTTPRGASNSVSAAPNGLLSPTAAAVVATAAGAAPVVIPTPAGMVLPPGCVVKSDYSVWNAAGVCIGSLRPETPKPAAAAPTPVVNGNANGNGAAAAAVANKPVVAPAATPAPAPAPTPTVPVAVRLPADVPGLPPGCVVDASGNVFEKKTGKFLGRIEPIKETPVAPTPAAPTPKPAPTPTPTPAPAPALARASSAIAPPKLPTSFANLLAAKTPKPVVAPTPAAASTPAAVAAAPTPAAAPVAPPAPALVVPPLGGTPTPSVPTTPTAAVAAGAVSAPIRTPSSEGVPPSPVNALAVARTPSNEGVSASAAASAPVAPPLAPPLAPPAAGIFPPLPVGPPPSGPPTATATATAAPRLSVNTAVANASAAAAVAAAAGAASPNSAASAATPQSPDSASSSGSVVSFSSPQLQPLSPASRGSVSLNASNVGSIGRSSISGQSGAAAKRASISHRTVGMMNAGRVPTAQQQKDAEIIIGGANGAGSESFLTDVHERMNQKKFFEYIMRIRKYDVFTRTHIYSLDEFVKLTTPGSVFKKRGKKAKALDTAIAEYGRSIATFTGLLKTARIFCLEREGQASATTQIEFSFPGFDSQVFDVGRFAVVSAWQLFPNQNSPLAAATAAATATAAAAPPQSAAAAAAAPLPGGGVAFGDQDFNGALSSACVAKELMQSSPDVSALYEKKRVEEAKNIMFHSQRRVLHNLCLCYYIRCHFGDIKQADGGHASNGAASSVSSAAVTLKSGETLSWDDVSSFFAKVPRVSGDQPNKKHIDSWSRVRYSYNPSIGRLQSMFSNRTEGIEAPINARLRLLFNPLHFIMCLRFLLDERVVRLGLLAEKVAQWQVEFTASKKTSAYKNVTSLAELIETEVKGLRDALTMLPARSSFDHFVNREQGGTMQFEANSTPMLSPMAAAGALSPSLKSIASPSHTSVVSPTAIVAEPFSLDAVPMKNESDTVRWAKARENQIASQLASVYSQPTEAELAAVAAAPPAPNPL